MDLTKNTLHRCQAKLVKMESSRLYMQSPHTSDAVNDHGLLELGLFSLGEAGWGLPDGTRTLMYLAWLSRDLRVRELAERWRAHVVNDYLLFDRPCAACGITTAEFMAEVTATAWELDPALGQALVTLTDVLRQPLGRREFPTMKVELLSDGRPCARAVALRCRLRLSQAQFADLLMTTTRTVKFWEAHAVKPSGRCQCWLALLARYAAEHGVDALRQRFVGEPARYGKAGRPGRMIQRQSRS
jgi:hypothetical protein